MKHFDPGIDSSSGKQIVRSKTLLCRPDSITSSVNSRRQMSWSFSLFKKSRSNVIWYGSTRYQEWQSQNTSNGGIYDIGFIKKQFLKNSSLERGIILLQNFFCTHFFCFFLPQNIHCDLFLSSNFTSKLALPKQHFFDVASQYRSIIVAKKYNRVPSGPIQNRTITGATGYLFGARLVKLQ